MDEKLKQLAALVKSLEARLKKQEEHTQKLEKQLNDYIKKKSIEDATNRAIRQSLQ